MEITVPDRLKDVLSEAKDHFVGIAFSQAGRWSEEYFTIAEIKDFKLEDEVTTLMILSSIHDSHCVAVEIKQISGIRFNKYLIFNGELIEEVKMIKANKLQLSN